MKTKSAVTEGTSRRVAIASVFGLPAAAIGLLALAMRAGAETTKPMPGGKAKWTAPVLRQVWPDGTTTVVA